MKSFAPARRVASLALFVVALGSAAVLGRPQDAPVVIEKVSGPVSVAYGRGGNIGLSVGDDGVLVIDSQFADMAAPVLGELAKVTDGKPVFLVNTHFHSDHVGGNAELGRGAQIVAHANVRRRMLGGPGVQGRKTDPAPPEALPDVTFDDTLSIWFNGEEVRLIHVPGAHTDGDVVVWFTGSNVVHFGDLLFTGRFPFIDVESGGRVRGVFEGIERVLEMVPADARMIPGHGRVCGAAEAREYVAMLREASERVADALAAGRSVADMREVGLLDDYGSLGDPDGFLTLVASSLAAE
jgi:glyoxylase-like metal-dependent hydrolase (beta-lactamase superfamily II)